jgi:hypothetical protein
MIAKIYDSNTRILMFELKVSEHEEGKFVQFLEAQGFTYVNHTDKWINKERGHECVIWK